MPKGSEHYMLKAHDRRAAERVPSQEALSFFARGLEIVAEIGWDGTIKRAPGR